MDIAQMQMSYISEQDRLLFRVRSRQGTRFALWLTRRMIMSLAGGMGQALRNLITADPQRPVSNPQAQDAMLSMRREKALQNADFQTPFEAPKPDEQSVEIQAVITRIDLTPLRNQHLRIGFFVQDDNKLTLELSDPLTHAFIKLIQDGVMHANWGFTFDVPGAQAATKPAEQDDLPNLVQPERPTYLN